MLFEKKSGWSMRYWLMVFVCGLFVSCIGREQRMIDAVRGLEKGSPASITTVCTPERDPREVMEAVWIVLSEGNKHSSWAGEVWLSFLLDEFQFNALFGLAPGTFQKEVDSFLFARFRATDVHSIEHVQASLLIRQSRSAEAKRFATDHAIPSTEELASRLRALRLLSR